MPLVALRSFGSFSDTVWCRASCPSRLSAELLKPWGKCSAVHGFWGLSGISEERWKLLILPRSRNTASCAVGWSQEQML